MLHLSVKVAPGSARAHAELGRALLELDRPAEALRPLKRAVDLDPTAWAVRLLPAKPT
jgi:Flp pilus assembly protein TadD